jgi:superfamily II DNA or RNA helicase
MLLIRSRQAKGLRSILWTVPFGYRSHATSALPDRLHANLDASSRPPSFIPMEPDVEVEHLPTPAELLTAPALDAWAAETRRSIGRLEALWLLLEDRHRLLDVQAIDPLAHQASLVDHVLGNTELRRLLLADEVGLGKTVEAALIVQRLSDAAPNMRVLYLTEARLVENVCTEFRKLGLRPRRWTSDAREARLEPGDSDPLVVASMHRAVFRIDGGVNHFETVAASGPWDMIVVDEAHHLTDWSRDGTDPKQRMRLVRRLVSERLVSGGRLLLMTGTPHQGHGDRFKNLLRLLDEHLEDERAARGRIIYRIKDDVRDWEGQPLFPIRRVSAPDLIDVGREYQEWFAAAYALLTPAASTRTGAWRRAQALQWCASSPHAGLAYLVRLALRLGYSFGSLPALRDAVLALRPYRGASRTENADALCARLAASLDVSDEEDADTVSSKAALADALEVGAALVRDDAVAPKINALLEKLAAAPDEKLVVFAQPVETVFLLNERLRAALGEEASTLIVGGQTDDERKAAIDRFWDPRGARVLVSSRSGGEGINLQVSRRLVHFDIPWNPMDMEQRVGRVHRYGSSDTILVDTLVLRGSREERVLARARARLGQIARDVDADRFELLFGRTMALIPLDELEHLMLGEAFGPLTPQEDDRLDQLVKEGYRRYQRTDAEFREASVKLRTLERGPVGEADLRAFLTDAVGLVRADGWKRRRLEEVPGGEPRLVDGPADVFRLGDGSYVTIGTQTGFAVPPPGVETQPRPLGLNDKLVAEALRQRVGGAERNGKGSERLVFGAGSCLLKRAELERWAAGAGMPDDCARCVALLAYVIRRLEPISVTREVSADVKFFAFPKTGGAIPLSAEHAAALMRLLRNPRPRRVPPSEIGAWNLAARSAALSDELKQTTGGQAIPAVFPIAAIHIEAD